MGFPFAHRLYETLIAMRLAERLGADRETASQTYYACLLSHAGCTAGSHVAAEVFGGSMTENFNPLCSVGGSSREAALAEISLPVRRGSPGGPNSTRAARSRYSLR